MQSITLYIISAVLFILGLAAIGGATFGQNRNRRLLLAVVGVALWIVTLLLYSLAGSPSVTETPTPAAVQGPTDTPLPPTDTAVPSETAPSPSSQATAEAPQPVADLSGRIVFHSNRGGNFQIWSMSGDGSDLQQLTQTAERGDIEPDWSPDGAIIVFSSSRDDQDNQQLYLMDGNGGNQRSLMPFTPADQLGARWSPDGQWIAFYSNERGDFEVYKVRADGSEITNLTNDPGNDFMPFWSPDGSRILFVSERDFNRDLYIMNADGSNQVRLTENFFDDLYPRWSPDGGKILWVSNREGNIPSIYWIEAPGPDVSGPIDQRARLLTFPGFSDSTPAWAADGEKILFSSDRDAIGIDDWDLYVMDADGTNVVRLTFDGETARFPAWRP